MKRSLVALLPLFFAFTASPQSLQLTIDTIMRGPGLVGYEPRNVRWSRDGQHVYFRWKQWGDPIEKDFDTWVVSRDGKSLRKLTEEEAKDAPPVGGDATRDRKRIVYADDGDVFLYESAVGKRRALTRTTEAESNPRFTRDERHVAFVRAHNLFVLSLDDGSVEQVTNIVGQDEKTPLWDEKKGSESQEYLKKEERGLIGVVERRVKKREEDEAKKKREHPIKPLKLEKKQSVTDLELSPDGKYVIAFFSTETEKGKQTSVPNYVTETAYTEDVLSRGMVGDAMMVTRGASISTASGEVTWLEHGIKAAEPESPQKAKGEKTRKVEEAESEKVKERDVTFGPLVWSEDGKRAVLAMRARDNKDWWLLALDPATAKGRMIASLHDDAWVRWPSSQFFGFLPDNATIWFLSEASGFMHLYTVPYGGGSPRALTNGQWEVEDAVLSDDRKSFYLTTSEESPFERHLYRMPIGGGARVRLTLQPGKHEAAVSPDGEARADVYSYTNKPPELFVQGSSGEAARRSSDSRHSVTVSPAPEFFTYPWRDVPIVRFTARDGAEVPARLFKPDHYAAGGRAIIFVHGAGYLQNVHRGWSDYFREYMFHHFLTERGYLVLDIDYRASAGYGRDWRTAIYRHMGGKDLDDQVDGAKWLVREHGVDPKRIGIYGGSYGGFITLMAMFTQPDVFAAGAALRPVTDWAHYNHSYTSNILNTPQKDPEAYRRSSPVYFAEGLKGALLICHGVVDTNVHFQDTVRLAQRLIELRKESWSVAFYPVEDHTFVEAASWADEYKRIFSLFERTLK